ncbi:MAG TPA: MFS transporter [Microlunatus sp.]
MADPVPIPAVDVVSQSRVGWRFVVPYVVAMVAMWMCFNAPSQVLIGQQLIVLDEANKERNLAIVLSVGAIISLVANPLFGMLSDRSRSRRGRRRPFLLGGAIGTCLGLALLAVAPNVAVLLLGWSLVQGSLNCYLAAIIAIIPDRVPATQRALVSGLAGLSQVIGTVAGVGLTNVMPTTVAKYALLGAVLGLAVLGLCLAYHDRPWTGARPAWPTIAQFFGSLGHRDFALAWLTRGLVTLGYSLGTTYLLFFLRDRVGLADPAGGVFIANLVAAGALLVTVFVGGILSDRTGRRKIFVIISTVVIAAGLTLLALVPTWPGTLASAGLLGGGFGVYLAVDLALITEVLPSVEDSGRDLGIVNIALTLPQTFAPVVSALFVTRLGGYAPLFATAALVTLVSAVLVTFIRGVR